MQFDLANHTRRQEGYHIHARVRLVLLSSRFSRNADAQTDFQGRCGCPRGGRQFQCGLEKWLMMEAKENNKPEALKWATWRLSEVWTFQRRLAAGRIHWVSKRELVVARSTGAGDVHPSPADGRSHECDLWPHTERVPSQLREHAQPRWPGER